MFKKQLLFLFIFVCTSSWFTTYSQSITYNDVTDNSTKTLITPPYLKAGDSVAILAPSGVLKNRDKEMQQAKDLLRSWGLHVAIGKHVYEDGQHFAGTDAQRAEDLQTALDNPNIKAIWCARGGYGTVRVLDHLDYTQFKQHPKWLVGYSDITALHNDIHNLGVETMHAMMCTSLTEDLAEIENTVASFKSALFGENMSYLIDGSEFNKTGKALGQLVGGNLTLLHTMLGSRTSIDTAGKILFIEEIGEYKYHIDRMLQSLKRAGYFDNLQGVIVGDMSRIRKNTTPWGSSIEQLILDVFEDYDFPILFDFPAGHEDDNRALILGRTIQLEVGKAQSSVVFQS